MQRPFYLLLLATFTPHCGRWDFEMSPVEVEAGTPASSADTSGHDGGVSEAPDAGKAGNNGGSDACAGGTCSAVGCDGVDEHFDDSSGACYRSVADPLTWSDALTDCEGWGGSLITIGSQPEQDFFDTFLFESRAWIGINDMAMEGTFVWANGEPVTYENWAPGEPNGRSAENCGQIFGTIERAPGKWNDEPCEEAHGYYCER